MKVNFNNITEYGYQDTVGEVAVKKMMAYSMFTIFQKGFCVSF